MTAIRLRAPAQPFTLMQHKIKMQRNFKDATQIKAATQKQSGGN